MQSKGGGLNEKRNDFMRCWTDWYGDCPPHGYGMKIIIGDKKYENARAVADIMTAAGLNVTAVTMDLSERVSIQS